ncbi:recombinase family protein [Pseudorhodobacter ferrugineus]|uniref:recombinase family protein n=1 Tax=Pseudorhodobacter ferrugineus TaxID=77008 RepID=UPI0003B6F82A|nr:recombinase family protein [Pseudorhodobacter ferrugineus]
MQNLHLLPQTFSQAHHASGIHQINGLEPPHTINDKGVAITFLSERLTFSSDAEDAFAKLQLQMMGAFAEFERNIIRKRQAEGIAKAKAKGIYKGGRKVINRDKVHQLKGEGLSTYKIAEAMGISRMSVHRILNQ